MLDTPKFAHPPVVELVIGAQFSPLTKMTAGHFGLFWKHLGDEWTDPADARPLTDQFELFDQPRWPPAAGLWQFGPAPFPGRFTVGHKSKDRLIQVQSTRFHLNWRRSNEPYPSYRRLIGEFEATYDRFVAFVAGAGLGAVAVNQWEVSYIDAFPQGEYWQTPADWADFLPGLFGVPQAAAGLVLEHRAAEWSYEIAPKRGRLHIAAQSHPGQPANLLLHMTARGPVGKGGAESLRAGLDLGHDAAVGTFLRVTSEGAKNKWEGKYAHHQ